MSEEVLNNLFELRNLEDDKARKYTLYRKIEKYITDLQQENKQLKEVIKKANEFIRKHTKIIPFDEFGEGGGGELVDYDIANLLKILEVKDEYRRN